MRSVSAIHSSSSPRLDTARHSSTSAALARMDVRAFGLLAQRREALVVSPRALVAPGAVRVAPAGTRLVEPDEPGLRVLAVAFDDPRHQLTVQLRAGEAKQLVRLLEEHNLPEGERELVVHVVPAEPRRSLDLTAQADPLGPVRQQRPQARVLRRAHEDRVRAAVARHLAEVVRLHEGRTT